MIRKIYKDNIQRIRENRIQNLNPNEPPKIVIPAIKNLGIADDKVDPVLLNGLAPILEDLAEQPLPIITVRVTEQGNQAGVAERRKLVQDAFTKALLDGVGDELIVIAEAPENVPGMIEVNYTQSRQAGDLRIRADYVVTFRKNPDAEPSKPVTKTIDSSVGAAASVQETATLLGQKMAGKKKFRQ
ncbi:MAG: hypothetical protein K8T89_05690 [Planctomycetes bacterium]|nr:hypothetical protein [Planctomycetota bacterium]